MGWEVCLNQQGRDCGYGIPAICDFPRCGAEIDRGLSYVCGGMHDGNDIGCGLYFCEKHLNTGMRRDSDGHWQSLCSRCTNYRQPFEPTPDTAEWTLHKLDDESWGKWRLENPEKVKEMQKLLEVAAHG